jgi:hypothetical protein
LTGTPIWCDARRRRDVCFVSSADRVGRAGHGQLIGTSITLALVTQEAGHLAAPVHRPFTLGTLRLSLIPSARCLGGAALHVDAGGRTVLYAGEIGRDADVRKCDAVVVAAPFGEKQHRFEAVAKIAPRVVAWAEEQLANARAPVLTVDTVLDGIEVATKLGDAGIAVGGSRSMRDAITRLAPHVAKLPQLRAAGAAMAVIRVEGERSTAKLPSVNALVSGRAIDKPAGWDAYFAWPFVAGRDELLGWIEHTKAKEVFVTGACAEAVVSKLGSHAKVLGPPRQMALFG